MIEMNEAFIDPSVYIRGVQELEQCGQILSKAELCAPSRHLQAYFERHNGRDSLTRISLLEEDANGERLALQCVVHYRHYHRQVFVAALDWVDTGAYYTAHKVQNLFLRVGT